MSVVNDTRSTFEKYLPLLAGVGIAWLAGRALKKTAWTIFGLYCAYHWSGMYLG